MVLQEHIGNNGSGKVPDSVVRIELISFYHRNPDFYETSDEVVKLFDYQAEQVQSQLEKLVSLKILEEVKENGSTYYRYLPPISCRDLKSISYVPGVNGCKNPSGDKHEEIEVLEAN